MNWLLDWIDLMKYSLIPYRKLMSTLHEVKFKPLLFFIENFLLFADVLILLPRSFEKILKIISDWHFYPDTFFKVAHLSFHCFLLFNLFSEFFLDFFNKRLLLSIFAYQLCMLSLRSLKLTLELLVWFKFRSILSCCVSTLFGLCVLWKLLLL